MKWKILVFLFGLAFSLLSCQSNTVSNNVPAPSAANIQTSQQFVDDMETTAQNFSDLAALADKSSEKELPQIIRQMQSTRDGLQSIDVPPNAITAKAALDSYMDSKIQCYFKRLAPDTAQVNQEKKDLCSLSDSKLDYFYQLFDKLK